MTSRQQRKSGLVIESRFGPHAAPNQLPNISIHEHGKISPQDWNELSEETVTPEEIQTLFSPERESQLPSLIGIPSMEKGKPTNSDKLSDEGAEPFPLDQYHEMGGLELGSSEEEDTESDATHIEPIPYDPSTHVEPIPLPPNPPRKPRKNTNITPLDVVLGRGELANTHEGNISFREERDKLKAAYAKAERSRRREVAIQLMDSVHMRGGAFLKKEQGTEVWTEVADKEAIMKCAHALREKRKIRKKSSAST